MIDGFGVSDLYAVGRRGEIWRYDGRIWHPLDSRTNITLTHVCCAPDGYVYICGRLGTLLRGREDSWEIIDHGSTEEDFWSLAWYDGSLYVSSMRGVYVYDGGSLHLVDFGGDYPMTCFHLSTADGVMWSIGAKDVMAFDGVTWARID